MPTRKIQNPAPYLAEAANAASSYLGARREQLVLRAEIRAKREAKRAAYGMAALLFANLTLLLFFYWISYQIHEAGVSSWGVALISLAFLGAISAIFAYLSKQIGHVHPKSQPSERSLAA